MENNEVGGRKIGEKVNAVGRKLGQKSVRIESLRRLVGPTPKGVSPTSWLGHCTWTTKVCWCACGQCDATCRAARRNGRIEWGRVKVRVRGAKVVDGKRLKKEKRDNERKVVSKVCANR